MTPSPQPPDANPYPLTYDIVKVPPPAWPRKRALLGLDILLVANAAVAVGFFLPMIYAGGQKCFPTCVTLPDQTFTGWGIIEHSDFWGGSVTQGVGVLIFAIVCAQIIAGIPNFRALAANHAWLAWVQFSLSLASFAFALLWVMIWGTIYYSIVGAQQNPNSYIGTELLLIGTFVSCVGATLLLRSRVNPATREEHRQYGSVK